MIDECMEILDERFAEVGSDKYVGLADKIESLSRELALHPETYYALSELIVNQLDDANSNGNDQTVYEYAGANEGSYHPDEQLNGGIIPSPSDNYHETGTGMPLPNDIMEYLSRK